MGKQTNTSDLGYSQIPHYSTHALEFFEDLSKRLPSVGVPPDMENLLCEMLRDSVKFLLPENGFLFSGDHDFKPSMFDLLRLPYPLCALEFAATKELHAEGSGLSHAAKRIVLCFDPWRLPAAQVNMFSRLCGTPFLGEVPQQCLALMCVYEANGTWGAAIGVVLIDLVEDRPMRLKDAGPLDMSEVAERVGAKIQSKPSSHGLPVTLRTFPARSAMVGQDTETAVENLYIDTIDEVRAAFEFLAAINCSNVGTQDIAAPRVLNERRKKKGRPHFYPYKVLDLAPAADSSREGAGASHASPRTHLRRGHIRQLGERGGHKAIWINATMVNAKTGVEAVATVYKVRS